jgi:vesicle-fusing ATPase
VIELGVDATRIEPRAKWSDLRLAEDQVLVLQDLCRQARRRRTGSVSVLFVGGGTTRTAAAEVIAGEVGRELYRIDLSAVVSKWAGETEKHLARLFDSAERGGAVLLFDEGDALFGTRSDEKDGDDRDANLEVGYLLDRIESHSGVVILASNRRTTVDQAVLARIRFVVELPDPASRAKR